MRAGSCMQLIHALLFARSCADIKAGWGMTFDPNDFRYFKAIVPCPPNTYGVATKTWGIYNTPCKACSKNMFAPEGSTDFTDCKVGAQPARAPEP